MVRSGDIKWGLFESGVPEWANGVGDTEVGHSMEWGGKLGVGDIQWRVREWTSECGLTEWGNRVGAFFSGGYQSGQMGDTGVGHSI